VDNIKKYTFWIVVGVIYLVLLCFYYFSVLGTKSAALKVAKKNINKAEEIAKLAKNPAMLKNKKFVAREQEKVAAYKKELTEAKKLFEQRMGILAKDKITTPTKETTEFRDIIRSRYRDRNAELTGKGIEVVGANRPGDEHRFSADWTTGTVVPKQMQEIWLRLVLTEKICTILANSEAMVQAIIESADGDKRGTQKRTVEIISDIKISAEVRKVISTVPRGAVERATPKNITVGKKNRRKKVPDYKIVRTFSVSFFAHSAVVQQFIRNILERDDMFNVLKRVETYGQHNKLPKAPYDEEANPKQHANTRYNEGIIKAVVVFDNYEFFLENLDPKKKP